MAYRRCQANFLCPYRNGRALRPAGSRQTALREDSTICLEDSTARELYQGTARERAVRTCCDAYGCGDYAAEGRGGFWPAFAHPRWLSCDELYCRSRRGPWR